MVVLGAGFAGLAAVRALAGGGVRVTLVDRNIYSTFQPLLYQVATGGLNPGDVAYPVRNFAHRRGSRFRRGLVSGIDPAARRVTIDTGHGEVVEDYDYLIVATGVTTNFYGTPGAAEHGLTLYSRGEAISLRDHLMGALERIMGGSRPDAELSVVVVGGGATGVEMAGTLAELRNAGLRAGFPDIDPRRVRVVLVEQGPELLAPFDHRLRAYTLAELLARGVEVRLGAAIREVGASSVTLAGGERLRADLTVWAAGVAAPPAVAGWGLPQGRGGRIVAGPDLRVEGYDRVFAAGDIALLAHDPLPQLAQPALQTGEHAGRQVRRLVEGRPTEPFRYRDRGTMATIGRRAAIVELPGGIRLTGTVAWLAWLALHVVTLLGNRNRVSTLLNLSWRYLAWPGGSGIIVGDTPAEERYR